MPEPVSISSGRNLDSCGWIIDVLTFWSCPWCPQQWGLTFFIFSHLISFKTCHFAVNITSCHTKVYLLSFLELAISCLQQKLGWSCLPEIPSLSLKGFLLLTFSPYRLSNCGGSSLLKLSFILFTLHGISFILAPPQHLLSFTLTLLKPRYFLSPGNYVSHLCASALG